MSTQPQTEAPLVFLGMPAGDSFINNGAAQGQYQLATQRYRVANVSVCGSALGQTFNKLWASALGMSGVTHFAMLHSDVVPVQGWLDLLMDAMEANGADVVSAACRIKDAKGLTSTAVGDPGDPWDYRRLTVSELERLPMVFGIDDIPSEITDDFRKALLVNTGCWVCDLRRPWWRERDKEGKLRWAFTQNDRISIRPDGQYVVEFCPEDWLFSRFCHEVGAKVLCARNVVRMHVGITGWDLKPAPGQLLTDSEAVQFHAEKPLASRQLCSETGAWLTRGEAFHKHDLQLEAGLVAFFQNGQVGRSVLDIGCGQGLYVRALRAAGVKAEGIDGNPFTPEISGGSCRVADASQPIDSPADWTLCLEVGEHMPAQFEEALLDNVCRNARRGVIVSWATPGQGGLGHVNERPTSEIQRAIEAKGFRHNPQATEQLRGQSSLFWFRHNLLVFERT